MFDSLEEMTLTEDGRRHGISMNQAQSNEIATFDETEKIKA